MDQGICALESYWRSVKRFTVIRLPVRTADRPRHSVNKNNNRPPERIMIDFDTQYFASGTAVVSVRGDLNETNREYFFGCVKDLIADGISRIVVDCDGLGNVTSSGLAAMLTARRKAESAGGTVLLSHVDSRLAGLLNLTRLNRILSIFPTTSQALDHFNVNRERLAG